MLAATAKIVDQTGWPRGELNGIDNSRLTCSKAGDSASATVPFRFRPLRGLAAFLSLFLSSYFLISKAKLRDIRVIGLTQTV